MQDTAAAQTATTFAQTLSDHDGTAACALLTDHARSAIESFDRRCETTILALPAPAGPPSGVEVWGQSAQVRFDGDVVFLARFDDGWKIRAAGCTPGEGDSPYSCELEG
ncbi:hypothetical protein [Pseudonocardia sp.]|uniref:hypothetical protein n=1 Tax=Pseudonocardia sp. TaxID=60912 RepID=UPI003D0E2F97